LSSGIGLRQPKESLLNRTFRRPGPGRGAHLAARSGLTELDRRRKIPEDLQKGLKELRRVIGEVLGAR